MWSGHTSDRQSKARTVGDHVMRGHKEPPVKWDLIQCRRCVADLYPSVCKSLALPRQNVEEILDQVPFDQIATQAVTWPSG